MVDRRDLGGPSEPEPLRIARRFNAPRALVFKAWSSTDHVKRWFCPAVYTIPQARVQMHVGGPFEVCMRAPDGTEVWTRGTFAEVSLINRLVLDLYAVDAQGARLFRAYTEVNFHDDGHGTRVEVTQTYTFTDPAQAAEMVKGAPQGWSQTLDKLGVELDRMLGTHETRRSAVHASFDLERTYEAPAARVFKALSDEAAKAKWFAAPSAHMQLIERTMDFTVGGRERVQGRWEGGVISTFDAVYHDIVPNERVVYTYQMFLDDKKISVSLATLQLIALGDTRTTLKVTEQGVFLDGYDDAGSRQHGTGILLDRLDESLRG